MHEFANPLRLQIQFIFPHVFANRIHVFANASCLQNGKPFCKRIYKQVSLNRRVCKQVVTYLQTRRIGTYLQTHTTCLQTCVTVCDVFANTIESANTWTSLQTRRFCKLVLTYIHVISHCVKCKNVVYVRHAAGMPPHAGDLSKKPRLGGTPPNSCFLNGGKPL